MTMRSFAILVFSGVIATTAALAASAPAAPAPPAPNATAPAAAPQNGPTDTETVGDWVVRCFAIKGPAPCDVLQVSVAKDNPQQRILSVSFAYWPDKNNYGMQVIVPLGVDFQRRMTFGPEKGPMANLHYTRCENDGCYVEGMVDGPTMDKVVAMGTQTTVSITPYGKKDSVAMAVSFNGFSDALEKLRNLARQKAVAAPSPAPAK